LVITPNALYRFPDSLSARRAAGKLREINSVFCVGRPAHLTMALTKCSLEDGL